MNPELEAMVARASNPKWIPAIYNYCDRRCARCRFNDRCFAYSEDRLDSGSDTIVEVASRDFSRAIGLLQAYAEREGIDLDAIADDPEADAAQARRDAMFDDPLVRLAHDYATSAHSIVKALDAPELQTRASVDVRDAVSSIGWLCTMIAPKICRALYGQIDPPAIDDDPVQNDSNGSAKVARLMIADSIAAWHVINEEGCAPETATTRQLAATLERIDAEVADRFPRAMEFVRPGFDEAVPGTVRPWSLTRQKDEKEQDEGGDAHTPLPRGHGAVIKLFERVRAGWRRFALSPNR